MRDGSADTGVSISFRLPYDPLFVGGGGRANGLGGPDAPALRSEFADGDGGGSNTPDECEASVEVRAGVTPVLPESLGEESAVALPASEAALGICTFSRGFLGSVATLFVLEEGPIVGTEDAD